MGEAPLRTARVSMPDTPEEAVSLDLAFDNTQQAIADALAQFCADRCPEETVKALAGSFPAELWREIAELGVLALGTPEGEGGALELVAALESLGAAAFPGPLAATFFATQVLPEPERAAVAAGEAIVALGAPPLLPWAPDARVFIEVEAGRAFRAWPRGEIEAVDTLGGEPWGRVELERGDELAGVARGQAFFDLSLAAYLAAAARQLVEVTAEHARTRKQFGRAIGEFQAVAHPLADCAIALEVAQTLARAAAWEIEGDAKTAGSTAAAARLSSRRAAVDASYVCHQLFGALGISVEGPVFHVSRRIRQLASLPPDTAGSRAAVLERFGL
jgi:alkylation response protein AidB-like acyl-CoA dehydrogenase